jgi:hypothetical protein
MTPVVRRFALLVTIAAALLLPVDVAAARALPTLGGSWSAIPALPANVTPMTATGGADGRLYVFGSCLSTCPQVGGPVGFGAAVTEVFDRTAGTWSPGRGAPKSCAGARASVLGSDGKIRLAGCWNDIFRDAGFRVYIYDTAAATWTRQQGHGPYDDPIDGMAGPNDSIYWFSDVLTKRGTGVFTVGRRIVVDYMGLFYEGASVPTEAPSDGAAVGSDGRVYAAGGSRDCHPQFGACPVPPVERWTPLTNQWSQPTTMPTRRIQVAVTSDAKGRIWAIAGLAGDASAAFATVEVYRPNLRTWARAAALPQKRVAVLAASTGDGRVWVVGGYNEFGNPLGDGYVFTPS